MCHSRAIPATRINRIGHIQFRNIPSTYPVSGFFRQPVRGVSGVFLRIRVRARLFRLIIIRGYYRVIQSKLVAREWANLFAEHAGNRAIGPGSVDTNFQSDDEATPRQSSTSFQATPTTGRPCILPRCKFVRKLERSREQGCRREITRHPVNNVFLGVEAASFSSRAAKASRPKRRCSR